MATAQRALGITSASHPVPPVRLRRLPWTPGACHRPVPGVALCPWLCLASLDLSYKRNCWSVNFHASGCSLEHMHFCMTMWNQWKKAQGPIPCRCKPCYLLAVFCGNLQASCLGVELWGHDDLCFHLHEQAGFSPACTGSASGADWGLSDELFGCLRPKPDPGPQLSQV